ncbi:unnamed protein product, partial [Gulo gulo]
SLGAWSPHPCGRRGQHRRLALPRVGDTLRRNGKPELFPRASPPRLKSISLGETFSSNL